MIPAVITLISLTPVPCEELKKILRELATQLEDNETRSNKQDK